MIEAKVLWYNKLTGNGEAQTNKGDVVVIYERAFPKSSLPEEGDRIRILKTKHYPGAGDYTVSARVLPAKNRKIAQRAA